MNRGSQKSSRKFKNFWKQMKMSKQYINTYQHLSNTEKTSLRCKFFAINASNKKLERPHMSCQFTRRIQKKMANPTQNKQKEIIKINKHTILKYYKNNGVMINDSKTWFFEKIN